MYPSPALHLLDRPPHTSIINTYTKNFPHWGAYPTDHTYFFPLAYPLPCPQVCRLLARWRIGPLVSTCYPSLTQSEQGARTVTTDHERTTLSPNLCSRATI